MTKVLLVRRRFTRHRSGSYGKHMAAVSTSNSGWVASRSEGSGTVLAWAKSVGRVYPGGLCTNEWC